MTRLNTAMAGPSKTPQRNSSALGTPVWRTAIDLPLMDTPALARVGNTALAAFGTGGRSASTGGLLVLEASTGKIAWQFDAASGVEGGATIDTTAVARAYFGDQLGRMHCLDLAAQRELWQAQLEGGIVAAPLLANGRLFIGTSLGVVACIDPATGKVVRSAKVQSQLVTAQPIHVAQEPRPQGDYLHDLRENLSKTFSLDELKTMCADLGIEFEDLSGEGRSGKARELVRYLAQRDRLNELVNWCETQRPNVWWKATPKPLLQSQPDDGPARQAARIASTPVSLSSSVVLVCALDGGLYRFSIDPAQPALARLFDAGAALYAAPIVTGNNARIILATYRGDVVSIDAASGREAWRVAVGKPIRETPCVADGALVFGTQGRTLHALDIANGQERWRLDWRNSITTTPLVQDGRVLFGDTQGRMVCVNEATREVIWEFDAQADRAGLDGKSAAVFGGFASHEGRVLCCTFNGCAYALKF